MPDPEAAGRPVRELIELVRGVRNARAEAGIEPTEWLQGRVYLADGHTRATFESLAASLAPLARTRFLPVDSRAALDALGEGGLVVVAGSNEVRVTRPRADRDRQRLRLDRELVEARRLLAAAEARLANPDFVSRAPARVVDGARTRAGELKERVEVLAERLAERA